MNAQAPNIRLRFGVVLGCAIAAVLLYLPAEAKATAFHDFHRHFIHPWESTSAMLVILVLCAASPVAAVPVFRRGSTLQRFGVAVILIAPLLIVARFLFWVVHQWPS
jgi:hypothetical protein